MLPYLLFNNRHTRNFMAPPLISIYRCFIIHKESSLMTCKTASLPCLNFSAWVVADSSELKVILLCTCHYNIILYVKGIRVHQLMCQHKVHDFSCSSEFKVGTILNVAYILKNAVVCIWLMIGLRASNTYSD